MNDAAERTGGDGGRLNVELRFAGLVALIWLMALLHALAWFWVSVGRSLSIREIPWGLILAPQIISITLVLVLLAISLPAARWPRRGSLVRTPSALPLLILGFPALLIVPLLWARDRRARPQSRQLARSDVNSAFHRLVRVPRSTGLSFLAWTGLAYAANAISLGYHFDWPRPLVLALALLWLALLGPAAALIASRGRAILRPEYLTAPRDPMEGFRRASDVGFKLAVNASITAIGAVAAPLAAGYLWMWSHAAHQGTGNALALTNEVITLVEQGRDTELGEFLAEHDNVGVRRGEHSYGRKLPRNSFLRGFADTDGDGFDDILLQGNDTVSVGVFLPGPRLIPVDVLAFGGLFCLAFAVGASILLGRDVRRDVVRATNQVQAVAKGSAPQPLQEGSFATRELQQLVRAVDRLVNRITETNVARYVAIEKAQEADRLKSQFLANMSHDLRSPLNSILGFSELLLTGIDGELGGEDSELVQMIYDNGRDLLQQIDDILDTAKLEAGRMEVVGEPTPPATLITRAIQNARKRSRSPLIFETDAAPGLPPVMIDAYRTVQALENVLLFAAERVGEQAVSVSMRPGRTEEGRFVAIRVRTPVPPATAAQLRRARKGFSRLPGHTGLGLGLPIASSILELQNAALEIEDLGDGMVFTVRLPVPERRRGARPQNA